MLVRFWWLGSQGPSVSTTTIAAAPALWTRVTAQRLGWTASAGARLIPRFEHVYPQVARSFGTGVNFVFHVQTEFPFLLGTGDNVFIQSSDTVLP